MKRYVLLMLVAILTSGIATAQTANRHGFFLEAGIGGLVGNTPRESFLITDNVLQNKFLSGAAGDFGLGGRFRISNHWAYEIKAEATLPISDPINALVARALPIGFRYSSIEIWRNYSLFVHFNIGGAFALNNGCCHPYGFFLYPDMKDVKLYNGDPAYGVAYSLGIGVNLTTHLYAECCLNAQATFETLYKNGIGMANYGSLAFVLGYRF